MSLRTITAIQTQKRRRNRFNLHLDGEYYCSLSGILAARLRVGQELDQDELEEILQSDTVQRAYDRALHFLSFRPRSEWEMRRYLQRKEFDDDAIESVVARLRRANLLDDVAFAEYWVDNREEFRPRGAWALRSELFQKGIARDVIDSALEDLDEEASAVRASERQLRRLACLDRSVFRRRLLGFLQRRGFSYGVARRVTEQRWSEIEANRETLPD